MDPLPYETQIRQSFSFALRESSAHFESAGAVFGTLRRLVERLDAAGIAYLLIGALAQSAHGYARMTTDIDIVMTPEGLSRFRAELVGRGYRPAFQGAATAFRDTETQVRIEIIAAGAFPGDGRPKPVVFPDPTEAAAVIDGVRVVTLEKLIELKLASGLSAPHRLRDIADVMEIIRLLSLPIALADRLDPSVRPEYDRLWHVVREARDPWDEADPRMEDSDTMNPGAEDSGTRNLAG